MYALINKKCWITISPKRAYRHRIRSPILPSPKCFVKIAQKSSWSFGRNTRVLWQTCYCVNVYVLTLSSSETASASALCNWCVFIVIKQNVDVWRLSEEALLTVPAHQWDIIPLPPAQHQSDLILLPIPLTTLNKPFKRTMHLPDWATPVNSDWFSF